MTPRRIDDGCCFARWMSMKLPLQTGGCASMDPPRWLFFFPERSSSLICFCPIPFYAHESVVNATGVALAESGATLAFQIGSLVWWRGRAITEFTTLERGWWVCPIVS